VAGENNMRAKLTRYDVEKIRSKYVSREYSMYKLAEEYGVSSTTIYNVVANKTWKKIIFTLLLDCL